MVLRPCSRRNWLCIYVARARNLNDRISPNSSKLQRPCLTAQISDTVWHTCKPYFVSVWEISSRMAETQPLFHFKVFVCQVVSKFFFTFKLLLHLSCLFLAFCVFLSFQRSHGGCFFPWSRWERMKKGPITMLAHQMIFCASRQWRHWRKGCHILNFI